MGQNANAERIWESTKLQSSHSPAGPFSLCAKLFAWISHLNLEVTLWKYPGFIEKAEAQRSWMTCLLWQNLSGGALGPATGPAPIQGIHRCQVSTGQ